MFGIEQHLLRFLEAIDANARTWGVLRKRYLPWEELDLGQRLDLIHRVSDEGERRGYIQVVKRAEVRFYPSFMFLGAWPFTNGSSTSYYITEAGRAFLAARRPH